MSGCQNCACGKEKVVVAENVCPPPTHKVMLDENGKCPCGKVRTDCCHKALIEPDALNELCAPIAGKEVC